MYKVLEKFKHSMLLVDFVLAAGVSFFALLIRLYGLGSESIWLDEAYTYGFSNGSLKETYWAAISDFHPPLFYFIENFALLFGNSEDILRLPSAIFGALTVPVIYFIARMISGREAGFYASLLFSISTFQLFYSQEARMYALFCFFAALVMLSMVLIVKREHYFGQQGGKVGVGGSSNYLKKFEFWGMWGCYVIGTAGALLTHNTAIFLPVTSAIAVLLFCRKVIAQWVAANVVVVGLWAFWLPSLYKQLQQVNEGYWISYPSFENILVVLSNIFLDGFSAEFGFLWGGLLIALFAYGVLGLRKISLASASLLAFLFCPLILSLFISLWRPIFIERSMIYIAIPFCVFSGVGLASIKWPKLRGYIAVCVAVLGVSNVLHYYEIDFRPDWRGLVDYVIANSDENAVVLLHRASGEGPYNYYLSTHKANDIELVRIEKSMFDHLPEFIKDKTDVWLVYTFYWQDDADKIVLNNLSKRGELVETIDFGGLPRYGGALLYRFKM